MRIRQYLSKPVMKSVSDAQFTADLLAYSVTIIIVFLFVHNIGLFFVPTESMEPTLKPHELVICRLTNSYERGDIVVFRNPEHKNNLVKRVIGLPGDHVSISDGVVVLNGLPLEESYISEPMQYSMEEVIVPEGQFFALGDNRNNSADSHIMGCYDASRIIGCSGFHFNPYLLMKRLA